MPTGGKTSAKTQSLSVSPTLSLSSFLYHPPCPCPVFSITHLLPVQFSISSTLSLSSFLSTLSCYHLFPVPALSLHCLTRLSLPFPLFSLLRFLQTSHSHILGISFETTKGFANDPQLGYQRSCVALCLCNVAQQRTLATFLRRVG